MSHQATLPDSTRMGAVILDVRNLDAMADFYQNIIGLDRVSEGESSITLGRGSHPIVVLRHRPSLPLRPSGSAGLFHTAILFQSGAHLASALGRVFLHARELYTGSADHHVSQAFYLDDPEGNGIELYIDRPREEWVWRNGQVYMTTDYLKPETFINDHHIRDAELGQDPDIEDATSVGHVHLQVGSVKEAREFYVRDLGFAETAAVGNSAIFVSAGGYHHHMAMNTWQSVGAGPRSASLGLGRAEIVLPTRAAVMNVAERLGVYDDHGRTVVVKDPWCNEISLVPAA